MVDSSGAEAGGGGTNSSFRRSTPRNRTGGGDALRTRCSPRIAAATFGRATARPRRFRDVCGRGLGLLRSRGAMSIPESYFSLQELPSAISLDEVPAPLLWVPRD